MLQDPECSRFSINLAVPSKRSSHYMKGLLIGAMSMLGVAVIVVVALLWVWSISKKERAAKSYTEVKKQVEPEAGRKRCYLFFN